MSDESTKPAPRLSLSHLGVAGGVVAAMVMLQPVKDFFYTREEGTASEQRIAKVEVAVNELSKEFREGQEKNREQLTQAMADQSRLMDQKFTNLETSITRVIELTMKQAYFTKQQQGGK